MSRSKPSLKRSTFFKLCAITLAAVLMFYAIGLSINAVGLRNVRADMQMALDMTTAFIADELRQDFDKLYFFMLELMSNRQLVRYALSSNYLADYERLNNIKSLSERLYMIKRASTLAETVQIMLPGQRRTIITEQAFYTELDEALWTALLPMSKKGQVTTIEWNERLWMLLPRYDRGDPLFMVAISLSPDSLMERLERIGGDQIEGLALLRADGSVFSANEAGLSLREARQDRDILASEAEISAAGLSVVSYNRINKMLSPFVHYRAMLWLLTLLSLGLLTAYLYYYRVHILRPLNSILDILQKPTKDGNFHINSGSADPDDIYARFNDMVDHIEALAAQVYEERYRAQKAELKQLQMQIDPHFLYNSLYLIYRIARTEGNASIANLSLNLSNYYRYITKMPGHIVLLRDEIGHVMNYLEIQRVRFEPRVHIEVEPLPEAIAQERIPSLVIQPIVGNAFQHGVKDMASGGLVTLRYHCDEEHFQVIVADNSGRMDDERVRQLWEKLQENDDSDANALKNLYRRLLLYENGEHSLELTCVNNGLTVTLTFHREKEAHEDTVDRG